MTNHSVASILSQKMQLWFIYQARGRW